MGFAASPEIKTRHRQQEECDARGDGAEASARFLRGEVVDVFEDFVEAGLEGEQEGIKQDGIDA